LYIAVFFHLFKYTIGVLRLCMKNSKFPDVPEYRLAELCVLTDMPVRTVRYYVQVGLVDKPVGETRAARYGQLHLEQLLLIKKWTNRVAVFDHC
jgi:hypothetical protein